MAEQAQGMGIPAGVRGYFLFFFALVLRVIRDVHNMYVVLVGSGVFHPAKSSG